MLNYQEDAGWVEHTYQVMHSLETLPSYLKDAESSRRGFLLTKDRIYIEQYRQLLPQIRHEHERLVRLTLDNQYQQQKIEMLKQLISRKLKSLDDSIRLLEMEPSNSSQQVLLTEEGKVLMDEIRKQIAEMNARERILLQQRASDAKKSARQTKFAFALANIMAFALVALASFIIHMDIVERRRYENALRKSEYRMQSILDNSTAIIYIKNIEGRYLLVNHWFEKLFALKREDIIGKTDHEIFSKEFADEFRKNDQKVIETRTALHLEEIAPHPQGLATYISIKFPLVEDGGSIYAICGISTDITERKKSEDAIKQLNQSLQQQAVQLEITNQELEAFSYSVSHDLRAPLRAIDGFSDLLIHESGENLDAEGQRLLDVIRANTKQMGHLIDDLLAFSRLSRKAMNKRTIQMTELARSVIDDLKITQAERAASVTIKDLPPAEGDPALIRQVFRNLISNAMKFSKNHPDSVVEIGSFPQDSENVYYVKDNGVGFNMDYGHKLFRVFERLHRAEEFPGTGVGLAIVERIVRRHGGKVWAEGTPNQGATFYFSLPLSNSR